MKMKQIEKKVRNGELIGVYISPDYFLEGDYYSWYYDDKKNNKKYTYDEWVVNILIPEMEKYDSLILYSDGTLYGYKGGVSYDISYEEFEPGDIETFLYLINKYGINVVGYGKK